MNYIIITPSRKLRRITETGGFWWIKTWEAGGFDHGRRITARHAQKLTRAAVQIYIGKHSSPHDLDQN